MSKVETGAMVRAFTALSEFTTRPLNEVIGQTARQVIVDPAVLARIQGAVQNDQAAGRAAMAALEHLQRLSREGQTINDVLLQYGRIVAQSSTAIRIGRDERVHSDLAVKLIQSRPLKVLASQEREKAKHQIRIYRDQFLRSFKSGDDGATATRQILDYFRGAPQGGKEFGAFLLLCMAHGIHNTDDIVDIASGQKTLPSLMDRDAVRNTIKFMQDVGWAGNLSVRSGDHNIYVDWTGSKTQPGPVASPLGQAALSILQREGIEPSEVTTLPSAANDSVRIRFDADPQAKYRAILALGGSMDVGPDDREARAIVVSKTAATKGGIEGIFAGLGEGVSLGVHRRVAQLVAQGRSTDALREFRDLMSDPVYARECAASCAAAFPQPIRGMSSEDVQDLPQILAIAGYLNKLARLRT